MHFIAFFFLFKICVLTDFVCGFRSCLKFQYHIKDTQLNRSQLKLTLAIKALLPKGVLIVYRVPVVLDPMLKHERSVSLELFFFGSEIIISCIFSANAPIGLNFGTPHRLLTSQTIDLLATVFFHSHFFVCWFLFINYIDCSSKSLKCSK